MELQKILMVAAACIGFINLSKYLLKILQWIWITFFRPGKDLKQQYGSWALVTGSTDGIGKALAFELAARGLNLVLVARNPIKLKSTLEDILQKHGGIAVKTVVVDFSNCGGEEIARVIGEEIRDLDLGILINNVGSAYPYARFFHEVDPQLLESVVRVNVVAATWVTKAVVRGMLEKKKKKKGAIVNVGSGSSSYCVSSYPLYTVYAATKAYVAMLSKSMSMEYKQHGIDVQCQIPLLVATKMASIKKPSFFIPSPETYSKASINWIGHHDQICLPYWPHSLQAAAIRLLPETFLDLCLLKYFVGMRARGLRKDSKIGHLKSHG
ncbi:hypothetical protein ABFS82_05G022300 [Erythranthe guttata]|uniref:Very-long-chain 3-oxoacyl-CoA reductase n=1 Tax=Erythranthe guttata TaxID=4155 RepID=A0A022Q4K8_ERYGU|nr:PREDICTED: very-long-chain 3-oxoacyl-CoA reductase 1 [Erythranthe guttata]EYU22554.1 hypothetical protein MIMGU_mgv1a010021mg [Erythranthe guttata]|eukprot:XP_012855373.1 PREDICTED: very-long-chain 3-oxoacyl-CoA reductase 1 [Erythranthe guttata]